MTRKNGLPRRVYLKHGRYWFVDMGNKWHGLTTEKAGLPSMFRALANLTDTAKAVDTMPGVTSRWLESKISAGDWTSETQKDMDRAAARISKRFADFSPHQVTTPVCADFLKPYLAKARTYNLHRSVLRQVLAFAALEGLREGHNPIDNIPQRKLKQRQRIVLDSEVTAIKAALMTARRGGATHCLMIDLCMLTGQRIGDVLKMRWQDVTDDGLLVDQGKTGVPLTIEWSPPLRAAVDACGLGRDRIGFLLVQSTGSPYRYSGIKSAWQRAMAKAGLLDLHIHDLRGRAGADVANERGSYEAQKLLGHDSIRMTEKYIGGKTRRRAKAVSK